VFVKHAALLRFDYRSGYLGYVEVCFYHFSFAERRGREEHVVRH
jgi:hypothetical protein